MRLRRIALASVALATVVGLALRLTGIDSEDSYWRGIGFVIVLASVAVLIASEVIESRRP